MNPSPDPDDHAVWKDVLAVVLVLVFVAYHGAIYLSELIGAYW